jgi:serine/threonine-protein kinase
MPSPSLEVGSTLASYTIEAVLGQGGMGSVYLVTQKHLKRKAALKVLSPELASDDEYRERFLRECELIAQLEHPNIVPIYDAGEADGLLYLAMRYIKGTDLRALISQRGHLSTDFTLRTIEQIASALDAAHAAGVVHRDVKPANILIERPGERAYLGDFGLARSLSSGGLTRTGTFLGTVDYCAPEQISGKPIDARVDVYSLGGVLYHCLAGQPPYIRETEAAVINAHVTDRPPALSSIRPDLPPALDGVVATAMAKTKEVRYSSAGELASAFRSALLEEPSPQDRGTVIEPAPTVSPTAVQGSPLPQTVIEAAASGLPGSPRGRSKRVGDLLVVLAAAGFVLAAAAALSYSLLHGGKEKTASKPAVTTPVTTTYATQTVKKQTPAAALTNTTIRRINLTGLLVGPLPNDPLSEGRCFGPYEPQASLRLNGVRYGNNFIACGDYGSRAPYRATGDYRFHFLRLPAGATIVRFTALAGVDEASDSSQQGSTVTWTVFYDNQPICSRGTTWLGGPSPPVRLYCPLPRRATDTAALKIHQSVTLASYGGFWAGLVQPTLVVAE